jgi:predicted transposase YdaD
MATTDNPLKQLFSRYVVDLVSWLLGRSIREAVALSVKFSPPLTNIEVDQLFHVTLDDDGHDLIVHLEFQGPRTDHPMPLREVNYIARTAMAYPDVPIVSIVIYIGRGAGSTDTGIHTIAGLDGATTLAWTYHVFRMWEMDAEDLLRVARARPTVLPLVGLTHIRDARRVVPQVVDIITGMTDPHQQQVVLDLVFKLLDSKEVTMILEETLQNDPMFANSPYVQRMREIRQEGKQEGILEGEQRMLQRIREIRQEERQEGIKQGIGQGIEQGIGQGIQEGERRMLQRILERRFGDLPAALLDRLAHVSASHVESLVDVALSADTLDAFVAEMGTAQDAN